MQARPQEQQEQNPDYQPPSQEHLLEQARIGMQEQHPREYKKLVQAQQLSPLLRQKVEQCRRQAASLRSKGMWTGRAWEVAIRQVLLELPAD